jgi:glucose-induced degradation protein 4
MFPIFKYFLMPGLKLSQNDNITFPLYSGSKFVGFQKSGRASYNVQVEIQNVDLRNSFLCGYLRIKGLTDDWPHLCTFFEGEIIGPKYSFLTRKWEADRNIDLQHWQKFDCFSNVKGAFDDGFVYDFENNEHVFMRWKVRLI